MTAKFEKWTPEWTGEDLALSQAMRADLDQALNAMQQLREELNLSQAEIATLLQTTQSNVSKIEAKADPRLSQIRRIVEGCGGKLHVVASFADGRQLKVA
jgi:predicted XRE-type DNA-binding protein